MKVELAEQVVDFVRRLPPEPKRRLRQALKDLTAEKGDIKGLEGPLEDYLRLRVGGYRVVLTYAGRGTIRCVFAEQRSVVYELLHEALKARLLDRDRR
jgi:mRNA-degrading endonuclease RelE of RelBE toxin-antitoxin system